MTVRDWIALVQAVAYLTIAIVAIITLRRASATLLQPLRTEAFKAQLEELRSLLKLVANRDEVQLRELFGFGDLVTANAVRLHDRFIRDVYGVVSDANERPYSPDKCSTSIVHDDFLVAHHEGGAHPFRGQQVLVVSPKPEPSDDARVWWSTFRLEELWIPNKQIDILDRLRNAAVSPLMPAPIAQRITELVAAMDSNTSLLFEVLSAAGRELPAQFPSTTAPQAFEIAWITNRFYDRLVLLPLAWLC